LQKMSNNLNTKVGDYTILQADGVSETYSIFGNLLGNGIAKYNIIGNSCSSYVSRALWYSGIPNIGISPIFLHASLIFRQSVIYNNYYYINH
jgi:hypothetical protein